MADLGVSAPKKWKNPAENSWLQWRPFLHWIFVFYREVGERLFGGRGFKLGRGSRSPTAWLGYFFFFIYFYIIFPHNATPTNIICLRFLFWLQRFDGKFTFNRFFTFVLILASFVWLLLALSAGFYCFADSCHRKRRSVVRIEKKDLIFCCLMLFDGKKSKLCLKLWIQIIFKWYLGKNQFIHGKKLWKTCVVFLDLLWPKYALK